MEFKSILIKDTTVEERKQIVKESLGNISASCDGCMARLSEMYDITQHLTTRADDNHAPPVTPAPKRRYG